MAGPLKITRKTKTIEDCDQNKIGPEFEMAQATGNNLYFQAVSQRLNGKFTCLKKVIEGR
ncbi:MAG: hypothetical protein K6U80_08810 [Firmicutes bacterium]|nr:hypothetical protein [Bacillota bacterium]